MPIGVVKEYISSQLPLAEDLIDQRARGVFSEWLVAARKASPRIGRRAIAAAWAQHLESERRWQQQLSAVRAVVAGEDPTASALGGFILRPLDDPGDNPLASPSAGASGVAADVLDGFDLTPVYTASHVYQTLGRGNAFWAYYCEERGKQLSIALTTKDGGGDSFMTHYQEYFSQARLRDGGPGVSQLQLLPREKCAALRGNVSCGCYPVNSRPAAPRVPFCRWLGFSWWRTGLRAQRGRSTTDRQAAEAPWMALLRCLLSFILRGVARKVTHGRRVRRSCSSASSSPRR